MGKKKIIGGILIFFVVIGYFVYTNKTNANDKKNNQTEEKIKSVNTIKLKELNSGKNYIVRQGVIKGQKEIYLSSKAEGRVTKLYKDIGQRVYKGQLLAKIDGKEYWSQVNVAQTGYDFAKKSVEKTKDFFANQIKQAKKGRELAKEAYKVAKKSGDEEQIGKMKANYEMAKKAVKTAESGYELQVKMAKGNRDVALSQLSAASTVANNTNLKAPFSGVVSQVMVEVGDLVSPKRPMFLLVDDSAKEVRVSVENKFLKDVEVGDIVKMETLRGDEIEGKVKALSPMIDTHSRKGIIKVALSDNVKDVNIGEYVKVYLPQNSEKTEEKEVLIPQNAVVRLYHDNFVFTLNGERVNKVRVVLGDVVGESVVVTDGLKGDETIIVNGQQYLNDGDKVKVNK